MKAFSSANNGPVLAKKGAAELTKFADFLASGVFEKPVLDKPETAAFLGIKPRTLDEWMRRKRIPFSKLPSGAVRFRRDQLIEFLKKYEVA
jgi:excisionase family DNA binding protein